VKLSQLTLLVIAARFLSRENRSPARAERIASPARAERIVLPVCAKRVASPPWAKPFASEVYSGHLPLPLRHRNAQWQYPEEAMRCEAFP
jgi:hypothetical protein